jgi:hypothetical protein
MKMTNQEIAMAYLRCFCEGDVEGMEPLLAPDLRVTGTLHTFESRKEYLDSLREDPPEECGYNVLGVTENEDSVALFYEYQKPDGLVQIAQLFRVRNQRIHEMLLVFDGRGFT